MEFTTYQKNLYKSKNFTDENCRISLSEYANLDNFKSFTLKISFWVGIPIKNIDFYRGKAVELCESFLDCPAQLKELFIEKAKQLYDHPDEVKLTYTRLKNWHFV